LERKLAKAQWVLSRKAKGSANRAKARLRVAKIHEGIRNHRDDWLHKQVKTIVADNQGIFVEDLSVKGFARERRSTMPRLGSSLPGSNRRLLMRGGRSRA
jgi:putative transposase